MTTKTPPKGLKLRCNDLGEIEQIMQDDIGLPPHENGKTGKIIFSRLAEHDSQARARAFLTDLRIVHKVTREQISIQSRKGPVKLYFSGLKAGAQFMIAGAETLEQLEQLFTEINTAASQQTTQPPPILRRDIPAARPSPAIPQATPAKEPADKLKQDFYELATSDTLTGLYNRQHFLRRCGEELHEAVRYKRSIVFMMLDIDRFGEINQKFGFQTGDKALQAIGKLMRSVLRNVDVVGRLGGDEFGALLLETDLSSSLVIARRLQKRITTLSIQPQQGAPARMSISIALIAAGEGKSTPEKLLKLAEKHLQRAQRDGGNLITQE